MRLSRLVAVALVLIVAFGSLLSLAAPAGAAPRPRRAQPERRVEAAADAVLPVEAAERRSTRDWYIVTLRDDAGDPGPVARKLASTHGLRLSHVYRRVFKGFAAKIPARAVPALRRDPRIASIRPDRVVKADAQIIPFGVDRIEASPFPKNRTAIIDGNDQRVDVDVAVLDTGIDSRHPDLNYAGGVDCIDATNPSPGTDGHGTHVAGTVGALDNQTGVVGVAPGARLWAIKVLNSSGSGVGRSVLCGLEELVLNANVYEVANMSLGGDSPNADDGNCGHTDGSGQHQDVCAAVQAGVTIVVAAGNECKDAKDAFPAAFDEVITVSAITDSDGQPGGDGVARTASNCANPRQNATNNDDTFATFSNFGRDVDLAAPGVAILSTTVGGGYGLKNGTSMAPPHVAGAAALYKAAHPAATPAQVRADLIANRERVDIFGDPDGFDEGILNVNDGGPWSGIANDDPLTATQIDQVGPAVFTATQDTQIATTDPDDPGCTPAGPGQLTRRPGRTVWYRYDLAANQRLEVSTEGSTFDTVLGVYTGTPGAFTQVDCSDDAPGIEPRSRLIFNATAGRAYYFMVGTYATGGGGSLTFRLRAVAPSPNDDFAQAIVVNPLPFDDAADTSSATTALDDPDFSCAPNRGHTVWYRFTPTAAQQISVDLIGSNYATVLGVDTGARGALTQVACGAANSDLIQPRVEFAAAAGTTYSIMVAAFGNQAGGRLAFAVRTAPPVDTTPPTVPVLTLTETDPDALVRGTTLFYNPGGDGVVVTVAAATTDPESGVARVLFPAVFGGDDGTDVDAPFEHRYAWATGADAAGTQTVTAINGRALRSTAGFVVTPDGAAPTVAITAPAAGATVASGVTIRANAGDPGSGAGVAKVEVRSCPGTTCAFETGTRIGIDTPPPPTRSSGAAEWPTGPTPWWPGRPTGSATSATRRRSG